MVKRDPKRYFSSEERIVLLKRAKSKCKICGKHLTFRTMCGDHVYPWKLGGPTTLKNGQALCKKCNKLKGNKVYKKVKPQLEQNQRKITQWIQNQIAIVSRLQT